MTSHTFMERARSLVLSVALYLSLFSGACYGDSDALTVTNLGLTNAQLTRLLNAVNPPKGSPGIAMGSPVGFGASWGSAGIGIGGASRDDPDNQDVDGSMGLVFGLGDAQNTVGLETTVNIISLTNNASDSAFAEDGSLNLKLHRQLTPDLAVALGVESVGRWGAAQRGRSSLFVTGTKFFMADTENSVHTIAVTLGAGENRFDYDGKDGTSIFGAVAWIPHEKFSVIADWTGRDLNAGISVAPLRHLPLTITIGAINLQERLGQETEFNGGVGYSFSF